MLNCYQNTIFIKVILSINSQELLLEITLVSFILCFGGGGSNHFSSSIF